MATATMSPVVTEIKKKKERENRSQLTEVVRWSGYELAIRKHWPPLNIYPRKVGSNR